MTRKLLSLALVLMFAASFLMAESVEDIINKSIKASGGAEKYAAVKSIKMTGKMNMMGMEMPFTSYNKKPKFRMDQEVMGSKMTQAFNGVKGWMINPMGGSASAQEVPDDMLAGMRKQADMGNNPVTQLKEEGITATLEGKEKTDGIEAYKLKMVTKANETSYLFVNATTFLAHKLTSSQEMMGQKMDVEILFKDYKVFDGITFATIMEVQASGQTITMTFESIEPNAKIDDSIFEMPKE